MARLKQQSKDSVHLLTMKDGDVAVIDQWGVHLGYIGKVVQRYKDYLISVGEASGQGWGEVFANSSEMKDCYVRILKSGAEIVL